MKKITTLLAILCAFIFSKSFSQTTLTVGDLSIIGFNANTPDNFAFVSWVPLQNNTIIKFTDNAFLAATSATATNNGRGGENFVMWQNNTGSTIAAGTVIKIEGLTTTLGTATAGSAGGLNGLSGSGDQIFAYQGAGTGATPDWGTNSNPTTFTGTILYGFTFQGSGTITTWLGTGTPTSNTSYLPSELNVANGNIALASSASRGEYTGARNNQTNFNDYKALVNNTTNWTTAAGAGILTLNTTNFTLAGANLSVNLSVSANAGTEAGATVITVTATASAPVVGNQTVNLAVTGANITAGDYTLTNTVITIPNGGTIGSETFTIVDDAVIETLETATLTISNPSASIVLGTTLTQNIDITDNDTPPNAVNLSVSTNTGSEENTTLIVVTATATVPVVGNQTVALAISGTGITSTDYSLSNATITILNGQTTGTVNFIVRNDAIIEGTENALLTISSPSAGIILGTTTTQSIAITDNICQTLILKSTATSTNGAEISAFDPVSKRVYTVAGAAMEYYTLSNTGTLSAATNLPFGFTAGAGINVLPNSVAIKNGTVAVAYALVDAATSAQQPGVVAFYNAATGAYINSVTVGFLPDMLIFSPDGTKIFTANEGEPNSYGQGNSFDPEGSVSIVDISAGVASATVQTVGFASFNSQMAALKAAGVRIYGPGATVAQDFEPEYISFSGDGTKAFVVLQENNAIAELDIATATFTQILPLGLKNHSVTGNGFDASDRDQEPAFTSGKINIQNWPVFGMYMPDAMTSFTVAGTTYFISANEGDSRDYTGFTEEVRVGAGAYVLDPTVFPNAATLKLNQNLGRLQLSNATGNTDADAEFEQIHALGTRSFSIWSSSFTQIFDSGDQLEQITVSQNPSRFNADNTNNLPATFDTRSDNKGPEPEAVATGMVNGVLYAFVGSERSGDIFVYDISNPAVPVFKQYVDNVLDFGVEGLVFVSAAESPTGKALVIASSEISRTVSVYEFSLVTGTLAATNTTIIANQDATTSYGNCTSLVANVAQNGASPISGSVTAKVWIEATQPATYVKRHYEITPSTNPTTATGRVTLYFTQTEFDDFNTVSAIDLPNAPSDATGIANLIVEKIAGTSNNGTGLPNSYSSAGINIDPNDADIVWNSAENRWEVSVDVTGFSGFFVKTILSTLPVRLVNFSGTKQTNFNQLKWETTNEVNTKKYEVESSTDGVNFAKVGTVLANNLINYSFNDFTNYNNPTVFYRLKIVDNGISFVYSNIIKLTSQKGAAIIYAYPNPTKDKLTLQISDASLLAKTAYLVDTKGAVLNTIKITAMQQLIDLSKYAKGIYILKVHNSTVIKIVKE